MSQIKIAKFSCPDCERKYVWKEQLAGKKAKCKCGRMIEVPAIAPSAPPPVQDELYDIADTPFERPVKKVLKLAPPSPAMATAGAAVSSSRTLSYQRGHTKREKVRFSADTLMDMKRDVYVPVGLLIGGVILFVSFFAAHYNMRGQGIALVSVGLFVMTAFKAAMLVGFALVVAGPLGVGFGGLWTAVFKLAAIAVFCDGAITWIDAGVTRISGGIGGGGIMSFGVISFPIALGIYWALLIYLFSMDPGDSWLVVILLSIFDRGVKWLIAMLLIGMILNWGGVSTPRVQGGATQQATHTPTAMISDTLAVEVQQLKERESLLEAAKYIADGHQAVLDKPVKDWYAAGCPNVWFAMSHPDINGRRSAENVIVELPADPAGRAKCFAVFRAYYDSVQIGYGPDEMKDSGQGYLQVDMR